MSRNRRRIDFYNKLIKKRGQDEIMKDKDKDNRDDMVDVLIEKNKDFRRVNILAKAQDLKKESIVLNKSFLQLRNGFINTENKQEYIKLNKYTFRNLKPNEQEKLLKLYIDLLDK